MATSSEPFVLPGMPASIDRRVVMRAVKAIGIDPNHVTNLSLAADGIYAEVFALDENGRKVLDIGLETAFAKHRIFIPFTDPTEPAETES